MLVRKSQLEVVDGPDRGQVIAVQGDPVVVGSDEDCDLVLSDAAVSGRHFCLHPEAEGFLLRDLGSTNGTFAGGFRTVAVYLGGPTTISIGQTRLTFAPLDDELELPLSRRARFGALLGHSLAMRAIFAVLERVADSDATLLIEGESGTGKDLAARAVHEHSARKEGLFVAVDCGAIPAGLIESELFGHKKGAFTGADQDRRGPLEEADGGTVFLDEIGELPLDLQPKLLRALESRELRRVGENTPRPFDVRLIAATNRNLAREVQAGRFRQDLYFRLSVIKVRMPTLRERREEIPRLVAHFLADSGRDPSQELPPSIMTALMHHPWPGNVRELRNAVERLALLPGMAPEFYLDAHGDGATTPTGANSAAADNAANTDTVPVDLSFHEGKQRAIDRFERRYLSAMLSRCQGNIAELARATGLSRQSCYRLLSRHGLG